MDKILSRDLSAHTVARFIALGLVLCLGYWVFARYVGPISAADAYAEIVAGIDSSESSLAFPEAWKPVAPLSTTLLKAMDKLLVGIGLQEYPSPAFFRLFFVLCLFPVFLQLTRLVRQHKASLLSLLPVMLPLLYSAVADGDFDVLLFSLIMGALTLAQGRHQALSGVLAGFAGLLSAPAWVGAFGILVVAKKKMHFLAAFLAVVVMGAALEWQATSAWITYITDSGLPWSRFRSDIFSAIGKNLVPITWSLLWVIPTVSVALAASCLWFYRRVWLNRAGMGTLYPLSALVVLVLLNGMPGLSPSAGIIALPFIAMAALNDRRVLVPLVLFCFALWFDLYGKNEFVQILSSNNLGGGERWTMPSYLGICAMHFIVALLLLRIVRLPTAPACEISEKIAFKFDLQSLIASMRSLPPVPPLQFAPVLAIAGLTCVAIWLNCTDLGARRFPITGVNKNTSVTVHFPPGAVPEALWLAQVFGQTDFKVSCDGRFAVDKQMGRTYELGWGYLKLPDFCQTGAIQVGITFTSPGLVSELFFTDKDHKRVDPTLVCESSCVAAAQSPLTDESSPIPGIPFPAFGSILDEMYNNGPGVGKILGLPVETMNLTSHPYLGRWFIYQSMRAFGIGAFGWRFPSALASAFLPLLVFFLGRQILAHNGWALFSAVLVFADFLRITSGRTAYVDSQTTFWLLLHVIFALKLLRALLRSEISESTIGSRMLTLLGLAMCCFAALGAAIATKWNGLFVAPVSLLIIAVPGYYFFRSRKRVWYLVPAFAVCASLMSAIYVLPYFSFIDQSSPFSAAFKHATRIVNIHSRTKVQGSVPLTKQANPEIVTEKIPAERTYHHPKKTFVHVSSSGVNSWLFANSSFRALVIPFYPGGPLGLYIFGNPIVWWSILIGFFLLLAQQIRVPEVQSTLVLMLYAVPVLPWLVISRYAFCYHYLPAATFGTFVAATALRRLPTQRRLIVAAVIVALSLLSLWAFAPLIWGIPISPPRTAMIRWFDRWFFELPSL